MNAISFDVSGYTLTGGTITLAGDAVVHSSVGGWTTVESLLAGSSGFTKTGSGEIVLRAVSTYTGDSYCRTSTGTRSEAGRRCRDPSISLKKTCRKLGVSFWQYLQDRIFGKHEVAPLPDLIRQAAQET